MSEHFIFHDCPSDIKDRIRNYWVQKQQRIERLLQPFRVRPSFARQALIPQPFLPK